MCLCGDLYVNTHYTEPLRSSPDTSVGRLCQQSSCILRIPVVITLLLLFITYELGQWTMNTSTKSLFAFV